MRTLRSPNIIQFLGSEFDPPDNICIVTEFMERGSLFSILADDTIILEWPLILTMLEDAARGMVYLHTCQPPIIHRDLKSQNLLVDEFWRVKVSDFGLSTAVESPQLEDESACGTLFWTAPEVLQHKPYSTKADVYSMGIVLWECLTRKVPYDNDPSFKVMTDVVTENRRPVIPPWCPKVYSALMISCWDKDPGKRPDFSYVLDDLLEIKSLGWVDVPGNVVEIDSDSLSDTSSSALSVKINPSGVMEMSSQVSASSSGFEPELPEAESTTGSTLPAMASGRFSHSVLDISE